MSTLSGEELRMAEVARVIKALIADEKPNLEVKQGPYDGSARKCRCGVFMAPDHSYNGAPPAKCWNCQTSPKARPNHICAECGGSMAGLHVQKIYCQKCSSERTRDASRKQKMKNLRQKGIAA